MPKILENDKEKHFISENYNYRFNKETGLFLRWGRTKDDNPDFSKYGPELADIEISTICHGGPNGPCSFCYKSNTGKGKNMSFETFRDIFGKFPPTLTQIAFGIGDIDANPDLFKIMHFCRDNGVIPNITINGYRMTDEFYNRLVDVCGAVAVSLYDYNSCYNAVRELTDRGMEQVNIHCLLSDETFEQCMKVMRDTKDDVRLKKLKSIVFLWLKPKGNRNTMHQLSDMNKYQELIDYALENEVGIGFDSCTAPVFMKAVENHELYDKFKMMAEPCESCLFSCYINTDGIAFPCSFSEDTDDYRGTDMKSIDSFMRGVWYGEEYSKFRDKVLSTKDEHDCRHCTVYGLGCGL